MTQTKPMKNVKKNKNKKEDDKTLSQQNIWKRIIIVMCAIQIGGGIAIIGLFSFLPLFLSEIGVGNSGEAALWAGLISGVTPLMVAFTSPYWALQSARYGAKYVLALILGLVGLVTLLCAFTTNPWQILVLRIIQGAVGGFMAIGLSVVSTVAPPDKTAKALGWFQASMVTGVMFGPLAGGFIADFFGYRAPFVFFAAVSFLCLAGLLIFMPDIKKDTGKKKEISAWEAIRRYARIPIVRLMAGMQFLCNFGITGIGPILPLYIKENMGIDENILATVVGVIIFLAGGMSALCSLNVNKFTDLFPMKNVLVVSTLFAGVTFLLQYFMPDVWSLGCFRAMTGIGMGLVMPIANTYIAKGVAPEERNAVFGVVSGATLMGQVLGPVCTGWFAMAFGYGFVFWSTAFVFLIAASMIEFHFTAKYKK